MEGTFFVGYENPESLIDNLMACAILNVGRVLRSGSPAIIFWDLGSAGTG